jgi:hypothetical protein
MFIYLFFIDSNGQHLNTSFKNTPIFCHMRNIFFSYFAQFVRHYGETPAYSYTFGPG